MSHTSVKKILTTTFFSLCFSFLFEASNLVKASESGGEEEEQQQVLQIPLEALLCNIMGGATSESKSKKRPRPYKVFNYKAKKVREDATPYVGEPSDIIEQFALMIESEELRKKYKKQIDSPVYPLMVFGPPGTGKSTLAHSIALRCKAKIYELNFDMAPLKAQVRMFAEAMEALESEELEGNCRRILFIKGSQPHMPFCEFAQEKVLETLFRKFSIVYTSDIDLQDFDQMSLIESAQAVFKVKIPRPTNKEAAQIIEIMLAKKEHSLSSSDIANLADIFKQFDGHEIKKYLNRGAVKALREDRPVSYADIIAAKEENWTKGLNPTYQGMFQ